MSFQREMSSGFSLCCRADSDALLWPERTSRTTWALNCGVNDRRRRFGIGGRSWEDSIDYSTGPIPGAHFTVSESDWDADGVIDLRTTYSPSYDTKGNLVASISEDDYGADGVLDGRTISQRLTTRRATLSN